METSTTHWKLGLFLVLGLVSVALAVSLFGMQAIGQRTGDYQTYSDESVGGLGVGSSVRFRGITTIGRVARVGLAPDRRHVEITCALAVERASVDWDSGPMRRTERTNRVSPCNPDMRAQHLPSPD